VTGGEWSYKSIKDCPGQPYAMEILGKCPELCRVETNIVEETLGILEPEQFSYKGNKLSGIKKYSIHQHWSQGIGLKRKLFYVREN